MKSFKIKAFGITKDIIGARETSIDASAAATVKDLVHQLHQRYPELKKLKSLMVAVNNEYAADETILQSEDEIALIPPVSGG